MTLPQHAIPRTGLGGVTGTLMSCAFLADVVGSIAGGGLVTVSSPRATFSAAGAALIACAPVAALIRRRGRRPCQVPVSLRSSDA